MKINHFKKIGMYAIGLLVASALPMSLSSCSDSDDETSKVGALTIGTEQFDYEFSAEGDQIIEIPFTSTHDWTVEVADANVDWLQFARMEGHPGTHTLFVRVTKNEKADRSTSFTLKSDVGSQTFTVSQSRTDALIISNSDKYQDLAYQGGEFEVTFDTNLGDFVINTEYEAGTEPWIEQVAKSRAPMVSNTLTFKYAENPEGGSRTAHIYFSSKVRPEIKDTLDVTQIGAPVPAAKILNKEAFANPLRGVAQQVVVNIEYKYLDDFHWEVTSEDGNDWYNAALGDNVINIQLTDNAGTASRALKVRIWGSNAQYGRNLSDDVTITQAPDTRYHAGNGKSIAEMMSEKGVDQATLESIEVVGQLSEDDFKLLRKMAKDNSLSYIDLSGATNTEIPSFNASKDNNDGCFNGCVHLETLILPQNGNIKYIPINMCRNCSALKEIRIPEGIEYVDRHSFANCTAMEVIWLPSTLQYLYGCCFEKIPLKEAHLRCLPMQVLQVRRGTDTPTIISEVFMNTGNIYKKAKLYVPAEYLEIYLKPEPTLEDLGLSEWPLKPGSTDEHVDGKTFSWVGTNEIVAE